MQVEPKSQNRQVIPRWRSIENISNAELRSSASKTCNPLRQSQVETEYSDLIARWRKKPTIENASELVAAGILFGPSSEADKAASFIRNNRDAVSAVAHLTSVYTRGPRQCRQLDAFDENLARPRLEIARLKKQIEKFPRNALFYSEIARFYLICGQREKSQTYMHRALILRPSNRLLLRNFARLSVHLHKPEMGIKKLISIPKGDLWIDAALTALADISDKKRFRRYSPKSLIDLDIAPEELTELLAAAGTHEMRVGNQKIGKKLLRKSAIGANDNTVAQLQWSSENFDLEFDEHLLDIEGSFEARANAAVSDERWCDAISHAQNWSIDEPFSERPFTTGSYIAAEQLWDYEGAKVFAERGLVSNPHSATLLNNLAFAEVMLGHLEVAKQKIKEARAHVENDLDLPAINATMGLIDFRSGNPEKGRLRYKEALEIAKKLGRQTTGELAYLHLLSEEIRLAGGISPAYFDLLCGYFSEDGKASKFSKLAFNETRKRLIEDRVRDDGFESLSLSLLPSNSKATTPPA